jgi:hypothetical protein
MKAFHEIVRSFRVAQHPESIAPTSKAEAETLQYSLKCSRPTNGRPLYDSELRRFFQWETRHRIFLVNFFVRAPTINKGERILTLDA